MALKSSTVVTAPSAAGSVYTSSGDSAITTMYFCNPTASTITANIFLVRSGFDANGINVTYSNIQIAGNDTLILETERLLFETSDFIAANASPAGLVTTVSYSAV